MPAIVLWVLLCWPLGLLADWSVVERPLPGPARVYGGYSAGCIAGAQTLALQGQGYQAMRPSRNRYHGHPQLIDFIQRMGQHAASRNERLLIGDLSQPLGGPMNYGHRSHQSGLDVDIWLWQPPQALDATAVETIEMRAVVNRAAGQMRPERWREALRDALWLAASDARVTRIFVNPIIKRHLCRTEADDIWLRKLRPWWGHDAHFHVRLRCPDDSPECVDQAPTPPGSGCNSDLDNWIRDQQRAARRAPSPPSARPEPQLPVACQQLLRRAAAR